MLQILKCTKNTSNKQIMNKNLFLMQRLSIKCISEQQYSIQELYFKYFLKYHKCVKKIYNEKKTIIDKIYQWKDIHLLL